MFAFLAALALVVGGSADGAQAKKNQMVTGTIKSVDVEKNVLVIIQKLMRDCVIVALF